MNLHNAYFVTFLQVLLFNKTICEYWNYCCHRPKRATKKEKKILVAFY